MPAIRIPSPNDQSFEARDYPHPAKKRAAKGGIPVAFQITSPLNREKVLLPHALVMHINPATLNENYVQKKETIQTRGGFVEQHWGHELVDISADGTTGAFVNIFTGLSSVIRHRTIAWDRFRDLYDLYLNNGALHDPFGKIVLQGDVLLMYDRGVYYGTFRTFEFEETDDSPFAFKVTWSFKVEETVLSMPLDVAGQAGSPGFQSINQTPQLLSDRTAPIPTVQGPFDETPAQNEQLRQEALGREQQAAEAARLAAEDAAAEAAAEAELGSVIVASLAEDG